MEIEVIRGNIECEFSEEDFIKEAQIKEAELAEREIEIGEINESPTESILSAIKMSTAQKTHTEQSQQHPKQTSPDISRLISLMRK